MTWTSPPTVVTGQLYTAAMFNTYTRDNPNHLRLLTGAGDPIAANTTLLSAGAGTSVSWALVPDAGMLNQKVNQVSPTYSSFAAALAGNSALVYIENLAGVADGPIGGGTAYHCFQGRHPNFGIDYRVQIAAYLFDPTNLWVRGIVGGVPSAWAKLWNTANDGSGSGLDADTVDALNPGNASGNIAYSNAVMCTNLVAQYLVAYTAGNSTTNIPINNGVVNTGLNADQVDTHHAADITPNNARVWFNSVAEVTAAGAHWARDVALNGRLLLSADELGGNPSGVVFNPATDYGSHWVPMTGLSVGIGTLAGTVGSLDVGGTLGTEPNSVFVAGGGGGATTTHTHSITGLTVTGIPGISGAPALSGVGTQWLPMMRAGIWAKKS